MKRSYFTIIVLIILVFTTFNSCASKESKFIGKWGLKNAPSTGQGMEFLDDKRVLTFDRYGTNEWEYEVLSNNRLKQTSGIITTIYEYIFIANELHLKSLDGMNRGRNFIFVKQ